MDLYPLALSFQIAVAATALAAVVGTAFAILLAGKRFPGREMLDAILTAPLIMPPTVLGYYLLVVLGHRSFLGKLYESITGSRILFTKTGVVIAATIGALPFVVKSARAALEGVDPTLVRAARTLGAGPARAFFTVHLPLAARGIIAGLMLAFARSLGDFGLTLVVGGDIPGETQTASISIYDMIQAQKDVQALGLVVVFTAIALVTLYTVNKLTGHRDVL